MAKGPRFQVVGDTRAFVLNNLVMLSFADLTLDRIFVCFFAWMSVHIERSEED